jgi:hypothetical protein
MKVKMKTLMSGPDGNASPGSIVEVSKEEGRQLIDSGSAEKIKLSAETKKNTEEPPEMAAIEPEEKAVHPSGKKKKSGKKQES